MKKTSFSVIAAVLVCLLLVSLAACGEKSVGIIGGADGPTSILVSDTNDEATLIGREVYVRLYRDLWRRHEQRIHGFDR